MEDTVVGHKGHWELDPSGKQDCIFVVDEKSAMQGGMTPEMLEQIRVVVREELQLYRDTSYWEKLTEEQKQAVNKWRKAVGDMLAEKIDVFHRQYPELQILTYFRSDVDINKTVPLSTGDSSVDESRESFTATAFAQANVEGYPSLQFELEYGGKLYKGTLYYAKDVE